MSPEQRRARAVRARLALDDGALKEAFDAAEAEIHRQWAEARWKFVRERLHAELHALQRVRRTLASMAGPAPRD